MHRGAHRLESADGHVRDERARRLAERVTGEDFTLRLRRLLHALIVRIGASVARVPGPSARDDLRAARLRIAAREGVPSLVVLSWESPGAGEPPAMAEAAVRDGHALEQVLLAAWRELAADERDDDLPCVAVALLTTAVRDAAPVVGSPAPVGVPA